MKKKCYVEVVRFFRTFNQDLLLAFLSVTTESAATSEAMVLGESVFAKAD